MDDLNSLTGPTTLLAVINIVANIVWAVTIFVEYDIPNVMVFYHEDGIPQVPLNALICNSMMNLLWIFTMMVGKFQFSNQIYVTINILRDKQ